MPKNIAKNRAQKKRKKTRGGRNGNTRFSAIIGPIKKKKRRRRRSKKTGGDGGRGLEEREDEQREERSGRKRDPEREEKKTEEEEEEKQGEREGKREGTPEERSVTVKQQPAAYLPRHRHRARLPRTGRSLRGVPCSALFLGVSSRGLWPLAWASSGLVSPRRFPCACFSVRRGFRHGTRPDDCRKPRVPIVGHVFRHAGPELAAVRLTLAPRKKKSKREERGDVTEERERGREMQVGPRGTRVDG